MDDEELTPLRSLLEYRAAAGEVYHTLYLKEKQRIPTWIVALGAFVLGLWIGAR